MPIYSIDFSFEPSVCSRSGKILIVEEKDKAAARTFFIETLLKKKTEKDLYYNEWVEAVNAIEEDDIDELGANEVIEYEWACACC